MKINLPDEYTRTIPKTFWDQRMSDEHRWLSLIFNYIRFLQEEPFRVGHDVQEYMKEVIGTVKLGSQGGYYRRKKK